MSIDLTDYSSHCKAHQKLIVSKDPKSRCEHIADNQKQALVRQYHIDGDVICDPSLEKCDWMVLNDDKKSAYLIEINGSDIHKGMRQIDSTYRQLHTSLPEYTFYFRIIYRNSTQRVTSSKTTRWIESSKRQANVADATVKYMQHKEYI